MRRGRSELMQLSINCRIYAIVDLVVQRRIGGGVIITCREARRDWLQQLRVMNNR